MTDNRAWRDGAIFGELTVLGAAEGVQRNRQIYDAKATTETELTCITQGSIDEIERCNPDFKRQRCVAWRCHVHSALDSCRVVR